MNLLSPCFRCVVCVSFVCSVCCILGVADDSMFIFPVWWIAGITSCGLVFFVNVFLFVGCVVGFCWSGSSVGVEEGMVVFVFLNCEISIVVLSISVVVLFLNSLMFVCSCFISCICRLFKCCFLGAWSESSVVIFVIYD